MFGMCTTEEKQEMKGNGYTTSQISDIYSENNTGKEENSLSTAKKSYISIEAAHVGESGPGFYEYQGYYGDTITKNQSVSGSGFSVGVGYTFDRVGHIKLKYKKLTSSWKNDYGYSIDNLIKDYKIIKSYNDDENQILDDLKEFRIDLKNSGHKTDKFIEINDI